MSQDNLRAKIIAMQKTEEQAFPALLFDLLVIFLQHCIDANVSDDLLELMNFEQHTKTRKLLVKFSGYSCKILVDENSHINMVNIQYIREHIELIKKLVRFTKWKFLENGTLFNPYHKDAISVTRIENKMYIEYWSFITSDCSWFESFADFEDAFRCNGSCKGTCSMCLINEDIDY